MVKCSVVEGSSLGGAWCSGVERAGRGKKSTAACVESVQAGTWQAEATVSRVCRSPGGAVEPGDPPGFRGGRPLLCISCRPSPKQARGAPAPAAGGLLRRHTLPAILLHPLLVPLRGRHLRHIRHAGQASMSRVTYPLHG